MKYQQGIDYQIQATLQGFIVKVAGSVEFFRSAYQCKTFAEDRLNRLAESAKVENRKWKRGA